MKLNLSKIKRESEDDDFYHLNDGKPFKVAKAGLSETTRGLIAQHFAQGGEVMPAQVAPAMEPSIWDLASFKPPAPQPALPQPGAPAPPIESLPPFDPTAAPMPPGALGFPGNVGMTPPPVDQQAALIHQPPPEAPTPAPMAPPPAPQGGAPAMAMAFPRGPGINSGRDEREMAAANQAQQAAVQQQAQVAQDKAAEEAALRQEAAMKREARMKEIDGRMAANQARADKLTADIASSQIDPSRFWASKTTGQKVGATIALILGGLGQGLMRSNTNVVVDLMNKQVADDIEAQRINLGKKQSLLSDYMKAGNDLQQARELAAADMKDILAGQLAASAAKFGAPEAVAAAQQQSAMLKADAVAKRMAVRGQHMDMALKQSALEENRAQAMAAWAKAKEGPKGQQITSGDAAKIGELDAGVAALNALWEGFDKKVGMGTGAAQYIPGTPSKQYTDDQKAAAQIIGGILEGGKLTDDDYARYLDMLPNPGDSKGRAANKKKTIENMLKIKRDATIKSLTQTGFDTSGLKLTRPAYFTPTE